MKLRLVLAGFLAVVAIAVVWHARGPVAGGELPLVAITQIVSHPGLDEVRNGVINGLAREGFVDGKNIKIEFRNANGDPTLTLPIAQEFVRKKAAVIVPITTPSAMAVAKSTKDIPVVFAGVTDPVGVGLVASLDHPGANITGTSDRWPFEAQIRFFKELMPSLRSIGMLYKPGDDVSKIGIKAVEEAAPKHGLRLVTRPVSSPSDLYPSAIAMFGEVDAVFTGMDNLVVENLETLLKAATEASKPVLSGDAGSVQRGALAAVATNMTDVGEIAGVMVAGVLNGQAPSGMPVKVVTGGTHLVNLKAVGSNAIDRGRLSQPDVKLLQ